MSTVSLLRNYQEILDSIDGLPRFAVVQSKPGKPSLLRRRPRLRCRRLLRQLIFRHIATRIESLKRIYHARSSLEIQPDRAQAEIQTLEKFERSIPELYSLRLIMFVTVVATLIGAWAIATPWQSELACPIQETTRSLLTFDREGLVEAVEGNGSCPGDPLWHLNSVFAALIIMSLGLWLVLFLPANVFRTKRLLFCMYANDHLTGRVGVYALEAEVFREAGLPPPRELPIDLIASGMPLIAGFSLSVGVIFFELFVGSTAFLARVVVSLLFLSFLMFLVRRLRRILRLWSARASSFSRFP
jgi:hypothetical protein